MRPYLLFLHQRHLLFPRCRTDQLTGLEILQVVVGNGGHAEHYGGGEQCVGDQRRGLFVIRATEGDLDDDSAARSGTRRSFQHKRAAMKERAASEQTRREGMIRDAKQAIRERQQARVEAMKERNEQFNSRMRAKFGLDDKENGEQGLPTSDHPRRPPSVEPSV